jgi:regulator of replication initiation timing
LREENERLRQRLVNMEKMEKEKREEAESLKAQVFKIRSRLRLIIHINTSRINY